MNEGLSKGQYKYLTSDLTNYVTNKETLNNVIIKLFGEFHQLKNGDFFKTNYYTKNKYNNIKNEINFDPNTMSISIMKLFLEILTKLSIFQADNLRAIIFDFNIYNMDTEFIKNIQLVSEVDIINSDITFNIHFMDMIDGYYKRKTGLTFLIIDIVRLILFIVSFLLSLKSFSNNIKNIKTIGPILETLFNLKHILNLTASILGIICILIKLTLFNKDIMTYYLNINTSGQFIINKNFVESSKFILYNQISILESIEVSMFIIIVLTESLVLFSPKTKNFIIYVKLALQESGFILLLLVLFICCFSFIGDMIYGYRDKNFDGFFHSFIRIMFSTTGFFYFSNKSESDSFTAMFILIVFYTLYLFFQNVLIGRLYFSYRQLLLLNDENDKPNMSNNNQEDE